MIYSQAGCSVLPSTKTAEDKSLNLYLGCACGFSLESQDLPSMFIRNTFFEVKSNPDNHFCILPSQWTTDYRFPRPNYMPFYFHLYKSAWKSCKCHIVFSYHQKLSLVTGNKPRKQPHWKVTDDEKKSTKVLISEIPVLVFYSKFIFFCVEVTLQSNNLVHIRLSKKCGGEKAPLNNKVVQAGCNGNLQMW